jgi:hypothetical protein
VGHVDAGDQQDQANRRHQQQQHRPHRADQLLPQRNEAKALVFVVAGIGRLQPRADARQLGLRLSQGDAAAQLGDRLVVEGRARGRLGLRWIRHPYLRVLRKGEAGGHHADDLQRLALDADRLIQRGFGAAEVVAGEVGAHHRGAFRLIAGEPAADLGRDREDLREAGRHRAHSDEAGVVAHLHAEFAGEVGADRLEAFRLLADVDEVGAGDPGRDAIPLRPCGVQGDDAVGAGVGKRREQQRLHDGEDGGVRANSQRQREDGGQGEGRTLPQLPQREAKIVPEIPHGWLRKRRNSKITRTAREGFKKCVAGGAFWRENGTFLRFYARFCRAGRGYFPVFSET